MWRKYLKQLNLPESYISITLGFLVVVVAGLLLYNYVTKRGTQPAVQQPGEEEQVEVVGLPTTHKVSENENLWTIAEKYYASGYNWVVLAKENKLINPDLIEVGQVLTVPKAEAIKPEGEKISATSIEPEKTYTVVIGDNLWNIAVKEYGDGYAWTKIAEANNLANPDLIHSGNVLKLPR